MTIANFSINFSATLSLTADATVPGDVLCRSADEATYVIATTANLAAVDGIVSGVCLDPGIPGKTVRIQGENEVPADITGLAASAATSYVGVNSIGKIVRQADATNALGRAFKDGSVRLMLGGIPAVAPTSHTLNTTAPLTGGGVFNTDLTLAVSPATTTTAGTLAAADKVRVNRIDSLGWNNSYEVDFTSLTLSTVTGNGSFTVDGKTWTVINFGNSTVMSVGGSNGMKITCNSTNSAYSLAARTCPAFVLPITGIFPNLTMVGGMRITVYNSFENCAANAESVCFAVENNTTSGARWEFDKYHNGSSKRYFGRLISGGSSLVSGDDTLTPTTDNVYQIEIPRLGHSYSIERTGVYSSGFPTSQNMRSRIEIESAAAPFFQTRMNAPSDVFLLLGASTGNTAGTLQVRFDRLRIETRDDL